MTVRQQKTIFITITRSFLTRNILRSGTLDALLRRGFRVVVLFSARELPEYIQKEFDRPNVVLRALTIPSPRGIHRHINLLKRYLIDTVTTRQSARFDSKATIITGAKGTLARRISPFDIARRLWAIFIISRLPFLKKIYRFVEERIFQEKNAALAELFDRYKPSVVLATSIISSFDDAILKEAKRRRIRTIAMPKGWDNVTKEYYPVIPDVFVVPNPVAAEEALALQDIGKDRIRIVGLPQFDWYARPEIVRSREEHLRKKGLDPDRALIFFGSEGAWALNEPSLIEMIHGWIMREELSRHAELLVRPHYSNVKSDVFATFRGKPHIAIDDYPIVDFLSEKWDPDIPQTIDFVNSIMHSDVIISMASTLSLDGAAVDRPGISIAFGSEFEGERDVTDERLYGSDHMDWLKATGGAPRVYSAEELKNLINAYLLDPSLYGEGRVRIRKDLCYKIDGNSNERLAVLVAEIVQFSACP